MRTLEALPGVQRRRMLQGEWCDNEDAVYPDFDPDIHCFDELPAGFAKWTGCAPLTLAIPTRSAACGGGGRRRQAVGVSRAVPPPGAHSQSGKGNQRHRGRAFSHRCRPRGRAGARRAGSRRHIHRGGRQGGHGGIQAVQQRMVIAGDGRPRLMVHSSCANMISEFYEYRWADPRDGRNADERPSRPTITPWTRCATWCAPLIRRQGMSSTRRLASRRKARPATWRSGSDALWLTAAIMSNNNFFEVQYAGQTGGIFQIRVQGRATGALFPIEKSEALLGSTLSLSLFGSTARCAPTA